MPVDPKRNYIVIGQHRKTGQVVVWCGPENGGWQHVEMQAPAAKLTGAGAILLFREVKTSKSDRDFIVYPVPLEATRSPLLLPH